MNRHDPLLPGQNEAVLSYGDGEFAVLKPGQFVRCAVTGQRIALEDLRYWSVDLNEPYASPEAVLARLRTTAPSRR